MFLGLLFIEVTPLEGRKLEPDTRTVEVREVNNGYVVSFRPRNNPYPVMEKIAFSPADAAKQVENYLNQPIPKPRWGK